MDRRRKKLSRATMSIFLDSIGGIIDDVDVATFDSDGSYLKALVVSIEPVQSGTGDPSPDNVRPITGHSSVNVIVSPTLNPLDGTITNIPLGGTYYGGTLDVLTGVLTVDRVVVDLGTLTWTIVGTSSGHWRFYSYLNAMKYPSAMICSQYKQIGASAQYLGEQGISHQTSGQNVLVMVSDERYPDSLAFKTGMSGVQLCYELSTPTTVQLTGQQIATFLGTNNVWCDSGKIIHLEY